MKEFLRRIKVVDEMTTTINFDKQRFIENLSAIIDYGDPDRFTNFFEAFSSSQNEFIGSVTMNSFILRKRFKLFNYNYNISTASGTIRADGDKLVIDTEINGLNKKMKFFYGFVLFIYVIVLLVLSFSENTTLLFLPFIFLHMAFMIMIPYILMRRSVKRMKYDLEREFYYLTKT